MAALRWCGAMARRIMSTRPIPLSNSLTSSSSPASASSTMVPASSTLMVPSASEPIVCGRGDKRTRKGKTFKGAYGNARPKRKKMIQRIKDKVEVPRSTPWPLPFKLV